MNESKQQYEHERFCKTELQQCEKEKKASERI